jgi:hypothetical protein
MTLNGQPHGPREFLTAAVERDRLAALRHAQRPVKPQALRRSPPDGFIARRWASFLGPLRAKCCRADDGAGPVGRARFARI